MKYTVCQDGSEYLDYGCTARLFDMLEDLDALKATDTSSKDSMDKLRKFMQEYECYITGTNLKYERWE